MTHKSGMFWITWANAHAKSSKSVNDLTEPFRQHVKSFIAALESAGAKVTIKQTRRDNKRAYLFHWAWLIATGKIKASQAKSMPGVPIDWVHNTERESKAAAIAMCQGFGLRMPPHSIYPPSLTSNHIEDKAIDMYIKWQGTIEVKEKNGVTVSLRHTGSSGVSTQLIKVGTSYGVHKLRGDDVHWSYNGR